jgi:hypothetical protein
MNQYKRGKNASGGWRILYHQGTGVAVEEGDIAANNPIANIWT